MTHMRWICCCLIGFAATLAGGVALGQTAPATQQSASGQPATQPAPPNSSLGALPTALLQRLRTVTGDLVLTAEQKPKINQILDAATSEANALAAELKDATGAQRRERTSAFVAKLRGNILAALTPEQAKLLAQKMPGLSSAGNASQQPFPALMQALGQLDLSADQKQKISAVIAENRQQLEAIRLKIQNGEPALAEAQQLREEVRVKLEEILTAEQVVKFRQSLEQLSPQPGNRNRTASTRPAGARGVENSANDNGASTRKSDAGKTALLKPGSPAPQVRIMQVSGGTVPLSSYKGHVLVIEFGSLSAPTFRERAAAMEKLKSEMGARASFLVVYTREAYPAGQWDIERNKEQEIAVPQAADLAGRIALAQRARQSLKITMGMAVDSMDDEVARAFDAMPNGAVVIDKEGKIVVRQQWTNIEGLRAAIEQANDRE